MLYYTQLIFIKEGREHEFHLFEEKVLPFLKEHNAELLYRIRPDKSSFIEGTGELPYEIHLVTFVNRNDFEGYMKNPARLSFMELKNNSVERIVLIEGFKIG